MAYLAVAVLVAVGGMSSFQAIGDSSEMLVADKASGDVPGMVAAAGNGPAGGPAIELGGSFNAASDEFDPSHGPALDESGTDSGLTESELSDNYDPEEYEERIAELEKELEQNSCSGWRCIGQGIGDVASGFSKSAMSKARGFVSGANNVIPEFATVGALAFIPVVGPFAAAAAAGVLSTDWGQNLFDRIMPGVETTSLTGILGGIDTAGWIGLGAAGAATLLGGPVAGIAVGAIAGFVASEWGQEKLGQLKDWGIDKGKWLANKANDLAPEALVVAGLWAIPGVGPFAALGAVGVLSTDWGQNLFDRVMPGVETTSLTGILHHETGLIGDVREIGGGVWNWAGDHVFEPVGDFFTQTIPDGAQWAWGKTTEHAIKEWNETVEEWNAVRDWATEDVPHFVTETVPENWNEHVAEPVHDNVVEPVSNAKDAVVENVDGFADPTKAGTKVNDALTSAGSPELSSELLELGHHYMGGKGSEIRQATAEWAANADLSAEDKAQAIDALQQLADKSESPRTQELTEYMIDALEAPKTDGSDRHFNNLPR